jgi:hypothetical protein
LAISTQTPVLGLVSTECDEAVCLDKKKYNRSASVTANDALFLNGTIVPPQYVGTEIIKAADNGLGNYNVSTDFAYDDIRI